MDVSDDEDDSDYDQDDDFYQAGGKRGFQTNIDDFLMKFGSFVDNPNMDRRLSNNRAAAYKGPLLSDVSQGGRLDSTTEDYNNITMKESTIVMNRGQSTNEVLMKNANDNSIVKAV